MFYDLFVTLLTLFGSILAGGLVIVAIGVVVVVTIIVIKAISLSFKVSTKKEARKEMEDYERK